MSRTVFIVTTVWSLGSMLVVAKYDYPPSLFLVACFGAIIIGWRGAIYDRGNRGK